MSLGRQVCHVGEERIVRLRWTAIIGVIGLLASTSTVGAGDEATVKASAEQAATAKPTSVKAAPARDATPPTPASKKRKPVQRETLGPVAMTLVPPEDKRHQIGWLEQWRERLICTVDARERMRLSAVDEVLGIEPTIPRRGRQLRMILAVTNRSWYHVQFQASKELLLPEVILAEALGTVKPWRTAVGVVTLRVPCAKAAGVKGALGKRLRPSPTRLSLPVKVTWHGTPRARSAQHGKILSKLTLEMSLDVTIAETPNHAGRLVARTALSLIPEAPAGGAPSPPPAPKTVAQATPSTSK